MKQEIVIGTRDSQLALWQANWVLQKLKYFFPDRKYRVVGMKTMGDHILDVALTKIGDKGLFTKELEMALLRRDIDLAVHSMKDLPTRLPEGLAIGAVCKRENPADVLISKEGLTLDQLPANAIIGTSSLRRRAQLLQYRPELKMETIRGNLPTRLAKLKSQHLDAIILAFAGVHRLGLDNEIAQIIPYSICLPAVGQGSIGIEVRQGDREITSIISPLNDQPSQVAITAERSLMRELEGGCQVPVGALGTVEGDILALEGVVASLDGTSAVRSRVAGSAAEAEALGRKLAKKLLGLGAGEILKKVRQENDS
ncbi:MAG: hydroxymethylbilane synthase [Bacillota bacterium]|jgi:hydroxymethylbilane synthase